jgi:hypothetical protein
MGGLSKTERDEHQGKNGCAGSEVVSALQRRRQHPPALAIPCRGETVLIRSEAPMNSPVSFTEPQRAAVEQSRRNLLRVELMIHDLSLHAAELEEVIAAEEARVGVFDPKHFAYPCYAKAAAQRRDNLRSTIEDLKKQIPSSVPTTETRSPN